MICDMTCCIGRVPPFGQACVSAVARALAGAPRYIVKICFGSEDAKAGRRFTNHKFCGWEFACTCTRDAPASIQLGRLEMNAEPGGQRAPQVRTWHHENARVLASPMRWVYLDAMARARMHRPIGGTARREEATRDW